MACGTPCTWPFGFGDVQAQTAQVGPSIGPVACVASAATPSGDLHILAVDQSGGLWHTMRMANGSWPFGFGDVQAQTSQVGPSIGPITRIACATNGLGELHILAIDQSGGLWHTMRMTDGSWPFGFGDVQTAISGP